MSIVTELTNRYNALQALMKEKDLDMVVFPGNSSTGPLHLGNFRYFTDVLCYYHLQAFVARKDKPASVCVGSILHIEGLKLRGFEDLRISPDILGSVLKLISEQPVKRLGTSLDMLPAQWMLAIKEQYPAIEFVGINKEVYALRSVHTELEVERLRKCAAIADTGFAAVCAMAKPGVKMRELHAELDNAMKEAGAEQTFTLMSNGRFKWYTNGLPCIQGFNVNDDRVIKDGDNIGMEITPRYKGYWTQMVRTVCVGQPNDELAKAHEEQLETIEFTRKMLVPGTQLGDMLKAMFAHVEEKGYIPKLPFGHIVGVDLDEGGRGSLVSDFVLTKDSNVVLHPTMCLGDMDYSIFWGDSFLVKEGGGERLNQASTELLVL